MSDHPITVVLPASTLNVRNASKTVAIAAIAISVPYMVSAFYLDIVNQILLAGIGALSLMLLTGFAGQISLGHAGLLAAGAFTVGILSTETGAPFWITLPSCALTGAMIGLVFGLPSLRLRGLYLAVSTLAMHFIVIYFAGEYEAKRNYSTGIVLDPPVAFGWEIYGGTSWYFVLLPLLGLTYWLVRNLVNGRTGRAWRLLRTKEAVAIAIGVDAARAKLLAFVVSSAITACAGGLFAYYRGFVSVEAFSIYLSVQYIAMIIIGGIGSLRGAILGATFVTAFPYLIEWLLLSLPGADAYVERAFAANYAAFGIVMILFLAFEPSGLLGIWRRVRLGLKRFTGRASQ